MILHDLTENEIRKQLFNIDPQSGQELDPQYTVFDLDGNPILVDGVGRPTFYEAVFESGILDNDSIKKIDPTNTKYRLDDIFTNINCNIEELTDEPRIFLHPSGSLFGGMEINIGSILYGQGDENHFDGGIGEPNWHEGLTGGIDTGGGFGNVFGGVFPGINFILNPIVPPGGISYITGRQLSELEELIRQLRLRLEALLRQLQACRDLLERLQQAQSELELVDDEYSSLRDIIEALLACKERYEGIVKLKSDELKALNDAYDDSRTRLDKTLLLIEQKRKSISGIFAGGQVTGSITVNLGDVRSAVAANTNAAQANLLGQSIQDVRNRFEIVFSNVLLAEQRTTYANEINTMRTSTNKEDIKAAWNTIVSGLNSIQTRFGSVLGGYVTSLSAAVALL